MSNHVLSSSDSGVELMSSEDERDDRVPCNLSYLTQHHINHSTVSKHENRRDSSWSYSLPDTSSFISCLHSIQVPDSNPPTGDCDSREQIFSNCLRWWQTLASISSTETSAREERTRVLSSTAARHSYLPFLAILHRDSWYMDWWTQSEDVHLTRILTGRER